MAKFEYFVAGMHGDERKARGWARTFYREEIGYLEDGDEELAGWARECRLENEQVLVKRFKWTSEQLSELYAME